MKARWIKINLLHVGQSKKHFYIFRAKKWNTKLENILKKQVFNEEYEKIGYIKDIFGPIDHPFISVKPLTNKKMSFNINNEFYIRS